MDWLTDPQAWIAFFTLVALELVLGVDNVIFISKILALSFLLLIGFTLIVEGLHQHIPKGYIYFAMGFSVLVEFLNLRMRKVKREPLVLHHPYAPETGDIPTSAVE